VIFSVDKFIWQESSSETTASQKRSIAVLPFANMSGDPDQLFFSDGITEEILNSLVRVKGISVASRTSSFKYRGDITSIPDIAGELGVLLFWKATSAGPAINYESPPSS
jgi:adenylate cyclase